MNLLAWLLMFSLSVCAFGQESQAIEGASKDNLFKAASESFSQGKYQATTDELAAVREKLKAQNNPNKSLYGLTHYWAGIAYNRLQDFPNAIKNFRSALSYNYSPEDLNYEYGQALFASERLKEARFQFQNSFKRNFKRGVSLYYMGYISREVGEKKRAVEYFKAVEKLNTEEAREVRQASEMQIADIYLEAAERKSDAFKVIDAHVIPQYKKALSVEETSALAPQIQEKIQNLQRKYDLVMFKLANGRNTLMPPYFLRLSAEVGEDSNVTFSPTETTISKSKQSSVYGKTDLIGRYTFYVKNFISISPETRFNYTRYFNRVPEIYRNDNYLIAPALRTAYEHKLWDKPASVLLDYDFSESKRDVNAEKELVFSAKTHTFMLGERFNFWDHGETIVRLRRRNFTSYSSSSNSNTTSLVFEQIVAMKTNTLLFFGSYDQTRVSNDAFDTNAVSLRSDLIFASFRNWFTPSIGLGLTSTDPINNRTARGRELLVNPTARLAKTFMKHWRGNLKFDYQRNNSKDEDNFAFKKFVYAFELEYLF